MGSVKIFFKSDCPKCPAAKNMGIILKKEGINVTNYNLDTLDGLAEGAYYSVMATPTLIIEDEEENHIADFRGDVPTVQDIQKLINQHQ
ncbi:MAG: thioredoxin family protein [Deltaproteobacteria bacterium]|jgi:glutaredoxin|nr:MAG: thioredoxin family protein [Deltaproteobacteria bacterium]